MKPPPHILTDLQAASGDSPDGGQQRTQQLRELVEAMGVESQAVPVPEGISNLRQYAAGLGCCARLGWWRRISLRQIRHHGARWLQFQPAFARHPGSRVFLWQSTHRNDFCIPFIARSYGFRVLGLPHNLEALVPAGARRPRARLAELRVEARILRGCDAVFTISREELWLLAALGVPAACLPYHPPEALRHKLLAVRQQRLAAESSPRWLLLGTAENVPTFLGMKHLLEMLQNHAVGRSLALDIVGRGTESLRPLVHSSTYRLAGPVNSAELRDFWATARGLLVHQMSAAGVLTRIRDALYAGLPVVANEVAARGYSREEGIAVYPSPRALFKLLQINLDTPPVPAACTEAEVHFQETLRRLVQAGP